jgi:hypothetical protein
MSQVHGHLGIHNIKAETWLTIPGFASKIKYLSNVWLPILKTVIYGDHS